MVARLSKIVQRAEIVFVDVSMPLTHSLVIDRALCAEICKESRNRMSKVTNSVHNFFVNQFHSTSLNELRLVAAGSDRSALMVRL